MDFKFEELTLANACNGRLEEKFKTALQEVIEILEEPQRFVESTGGVVGAKVVVELDFSVHAESGIKRLVGSVHAKRPRLKGVAETIYTQGGVVVNQPGIEQIDFLAGEKKAPKVVPHPAAEGGES